MNVWYGGLHGLLSFKGFPATQSASSKTDFALCITGKRLENQTAMRA
jgi:hypothetical protein